MRGAAEQGGFSSCSFLYRWYCSCLTVPMMASSLALRGVCQSCRRAAYLPSRLLSSSAAVPDFMDLTIGKTLTEVDGTFNEIFSLTLASDPSTRRALLQSMRRAYGRKMLEECRIDPKVLARLADPAYLPCREEILATFRMHDEIPLATSSRTLDNLETEMHLMEAIHEKPAEELSFVENYRVQFGPATFSPLFSWCEDHGIFEVLTTEFVSSLAERIAESVEKLENNNDRRNEPPVVLEVAAGAGRLSHFLNASGIVPVPVLATDDCSWKLTSSPSPSSSSAAAAAVTISSAVQQLDHAAAVATHAPSIVLCAWMPENTDFTAAWRDTSTGRSATVDEYILIGAADSGLSGLPWETWGYVSPLLPPEGITADDIAAVPATDPRRRTLESMRAGHQAQQRGDDPPYKRDGFEKARAESVCAVQLSRRDTSKSSFGHSETITFQRTAAF